MKFDLPEVKLLLQQCLSQLEPTVLWWSTTGSRGGFWFRPNSLAVVIFNRFLVHLGMDSSQFLHSFNSIFTEESF